MSISPKTPVSNSAIKNSVAANAAVNAANNAANNSPTAAAPKIDLQQLQQKAWVKEQEINALKVQNRHLISKLEEAEKNFQPGQVYSQQIAAEVQNYLKPVIGQIEKSLSQAFELLQGTLRGVYQQSQRAQGAFEDLANHSREFEMKMQEQRKSDQVYFQEKIFSSITAFCDRLERQIDTRLGALSIVELMNVKQNEVLSDVEAMKQRLTETQMQGSRQEEMSRDGLQQIQNHRSEFKILRGETRAVLEQIQKLNNRINLLDGHIEGMIESLPSTRDQGFVHQIENLIQTKNEDINRIENEIKTAPSHELNEGQENLVLMLEFLRTQKTELKKVADAAKNKIRGANVENPNPAIVANSNHSYPETTAVNEGEIEILSLTPAVGTSEVETIDLHANVGEEANSETKAEALIFETPLFHYFSPPK
jgi:hypothetical protein